MRITNNMIMDLVVRNLSLSLDKYMRLQTMMSSGKRITCPSDDPVGVTQDLGYRSSLSDMEQFQKNINFGKTWLSTSENSLTQIANLVTEAKDLAAQLANDTYTDTARQSAIEEVDSIIQQIVDLANVQYQGRYVFSGHRTLSQAFSLSGNGIVYNGDDGLIQIETEAGTKMEVNIPGSGFLTSSLGTLGDDFDLNPGISPDTLLGDLFLGKLNWDSATSFEIKDENLGVDISVDLSSLTEDSTVSELITAINQALIDAGDTYLQVAISSSGNGLTFTDTDKITSQTSLEYLGITPGTITIEYDDPSNPGNRLTQDIDVTSDMTIGDLIDAIESAGVPGLEASINLSERGLLLKDTNSTPLNIKVLNSATASDLGIVGDFDQNNELIGDEINPFLVSTNTSLSDLNLGGGVDMVEGKFILEYGANQLIVNLSGAKTLGEVISKINAQCSGLGLTAAIDSSERRIRLTDGNIPPLDFKIREYDNQYTTATDLGIVGSFDGNTLLGGKLSPQPKYSFSDTVGTFVSVFGLSGNMNTVKDTNDLNPSLFESTPLSLLKNGLGLDLGKIKIMLGDETYTVDLSNAATLQDILDSINNCGAGVTASINDDLTGISISSPDNNQSLLISDADSKDSASALGIAGSPDIIGTLLTLKDALNRNDAEDISNTMKILGDGHNKLLSTLASVGAKVQRLETTDTRLEDFKLNVTKLLSEVEDADIVKVATDLAAQQTAYQAALQAAAQMLQPSLLDFID
jgi:flagellar hook-associated protein 3